MSDLPLYRYGPELRSELYVRVRRALRERLVDGHFTGYHGLGILMDMKPISVKKVMQGSFYPTTHQLLIMAHVLGFTLRMAIEEPV